MQIISYDIGLVNLAMCIYDPQLKKIIAWELINARTTGDMCAHLVELLQARDELFEEPQIVLIERQSKRSCKLQAVASYLQMYFTLKHKQVVLYSPVFKLLGTDMECKGKHNYTQRKKAAIKLTTDFLAENPQEERFHKMFTSLKKRDDVADALMQVLAYAKVPDPNKLLNPPKKPLKARKPQPKQIQKGKLTKNYILWMLINHYPQLAKKTVYIPEISETEQLVRCIQTDKIFMKSVLRHYNTAQDCVTSMIGPKTDEDVDIDADAVDASNTPILV